MFNVVRKILFVVLIAVLSFVAGIYFNSHYAKQPAIQKDKENTAETAVKAINLYGFIKEIKPTGFIVEYNTSQFRGLEAIQLTKEVLIDDKTVLSALALIDRAKFKPAESDISTGLTFTSDKGEEMIFETIQGAGLKDFQVGDYVEIQSEENTMTYDAIKATGVNSYKLKNNPYLENGVVSYEGLPLIINYVTTNGEGGGVIKNDETVAGEVIDEPGMDKGVVGQNEPTEASEPQVDGGAVGPTEPANPPAKAQ